jgi:flagellar protein FliS
MSLSPGDTYLETQIATATPQRLRLMLIEAALRKANAAQTAWQQGQEEAGLAAAQHCRNIISELISGIEPDKTPLARQVLGIYMFLFSALVEAQFARDADCLTDIIRVLEEELQTWQDVCEKMPERPVALPAAAEEVAPQRVSDGWTPGYGPHSAMRCKDAASEFSIEA